MNEFPYYCSRCGEVKVEKIGPCRRCIDWQKRKDEAWAKAKCEVCGKQACWACAYGLRCHEHREIRVVLPKRKSGRWPWAWIVGALIGILAYALFAGCAPACVRVTPIVDASVGNQEVRQRTVEAFTYLNVPIELQPIRRQPIDLVTNAGWIRAYALGVSLAPRPSDRVVFIADRLENRGEPGGGITQMPPSPLMRVIFLRYYQDPQYMRKSYAHEAAHTFGLDHVSDPNNLMNGETRGMELTDEQRDRLREWAR